MSPNRCDGLLARVDFPLYTLQTLTNRHVIVAGGGGAAATGVANGFEIFELSHNGTRFIAEEVMRHETGPNVVMNCSVRSNQNKTYLTAGQESHCQLYKVNIRMVDAAEMRRGSFRAENGLVRRRRRTVSENDNISKKDSNSNTTEKRISFEIRPSDSVQTDFSNDPLQRVVRISHNGKLMATGGIDGKVRVWSFPKMELLYELDGHTKEIDDLDYKESLTRSQPIPDDSSGKSGAKFYQSYDRLFILKTLTSEEVERMHSFLKHYHPYIVERHGKTLLPQYLGMYRLTVDGIEHYLVATRNVFSNHLNIHKKYDLKGSTVDREASEKELEKELPTLKDNDFIKQGVRIDIGDAAKEKLLETLTADVEFLTKLHLMDYSLLLGMHECGRGEAEAEAARADADLDTDNDTDSDSDTDNRHHGDRWGCNTPPDSPRGFARQTSLRYEGIIPELDIYAIPSQEGAPKKEIYFVALIDVLTHYGVKKQAAKAAKTVKYGSNVDGISTCDPEQYGKRFIEFVAKAIEGN